MGIFGWSLPPGCGTLPDEEPCICEVCGTVDDCICPECPTCGSQGDPRCYLAKAADGHGLTLNKEQLASVAKMEEHYKAENERYAFLGTHIDDEQEYYDDIEKMMKGNGAL